ncbi:hypothetical protein LCGC14_1285430 [marine sediment metagenome]|uniref:Phage portal protein n=1 Tax=marine sediment metagenome TaxID=412755 RepID=A0A0F9NAQ6_9ZZZZ
MTDSKKGHVYVQTSKGVYPLSVLQKAESKQSSKQIKQTSRWMTENDLIPPPYSPDVLLTLYESNSVFMRCVNQLAIDVAGLGWSLQLQDGKKKDKRELERLQSLLQKPNQDDALRTIFRQLLIDWGSVGWFGLEVVRNNKGEIVELYHVPAHTLRVHESQKKYCQRRNNKKVWFKKFGLEKNISPKDGKEGTFSVEDRANELIFYKNFYPKSDYYGVPNAIAAVGDVVGLIGLRDYNLAFFENYGIPSALIVLEGEWDEGSDKKVMEFLNKEIKGTDNAHRTLVVSQPDGCKFSYTSLGVEVKEASFRLYEQARKEAILIAYSMPPERVGIRITGTLGGNVAEEATRIYVQGVVEPLQCDLEDIVNNKLLQSEVYEFKFENIDLRNYDMLVKQYGYQIERGMMTPNEARNELGRKPYTDGDKFYMMSSLIEAGSPDENLGKIEKEFLDEQE